MTRSSVIDASRKETAKDCVGGRGGKNGSRTRQVWSTASQAALIWTEGGLKTLGRRVLLDSKERCGTRTGWDSRMQGCQAERVMQDGGLRTETRVGGALEEWAGTGVLGGVLLFSCFRGAADIRKVLVGGKRGRVWGGGGRGDDCAGGATPGGGVGRKKKWS